MTGDAIFGLVRGALGSASLANVVTEELAADPEAGTTPLVSTESFGWWSYNGSSLLLHNPLNGWL